MKKTVNAFDKISKKFDRIFEALPNREKVNNILRLENGEIQIERVKFSYNPKHYYQLLK